MAEINPDVLAQMHRIHGAVNDGTVDIPTIRDALAKLHDFLSGAAYEAHEPDPELEPIPESDEGNDGPSGEDEDEHPHKRKAPRKKR